MYNALFIIDAHVKSGAFIRKCVVKLSTMSLLHLYVKYYYLSYGYRNNLDNRDNLLVNIEI